MLRFDIIVILNTYKQIQTYFYYVYSVINYNVNLHIHTQSPKNDENSRTEIGHYNHRIVKNVNLILQLNICRMSKIFIQNNNNNNNDNENNNRNYYSPFMVNDQLFDFRFADSFLWE